MAARLLLALAAFGLALASASVVGYYEREPRLQLEADVPLHAIGSARNFLVEGRVTEADALDLQIVLKHDLGAVERLHEVSARTDRS